MASSQNTTEPLIDSHCHLDFADFDLDRDKVLAQAVSAGIKHFVIPGIKATQWPALLSLKKHHPHISIAAGLHPYFIQQHRPEDLALLADFVEQHHRELVAIGEIGIDKTCTDLTQQEYLFAQQLELANEYALPVILHHRQSHDRLLKYLKQCTPSNGGVVHAFSGSIQEAEAYLSLGFKFGIGGVITYPRASKTRNTVAQLPLSSLLLETDSPDMPVNGFQGQRNEPQRLLNVLRALSEIRTESQEQLARTIYTNTRDLFTLPVPLHQDGSDL